jgi:hypothetical protein
MQFSCKKILLLFSLAAASWAADSPYFVTYSHHMEEPGSLEFSSTHLVGRPQGGNGFLSQLLELEYGLKGWWTTELYLSGQSTRRESTQFTGVRWENRFRPLMREHWINPVLYVEYVDINGADKTLKEIVGHDGIQDQLEPNSERRLEPKREIETKLILSSDFKGWNISENLIAEKDLSNEPWEFGYSVGISRPLALAASARPCTFCRENFLAGAEIYGGLGDRYSFGLRDTSHYVAPTLAWLLPGGAKLQVSPGFGLTGSSHGMLLRLSVGYEISQFGRFFRK